MVDRSNVLAVSLRLAVTRLAEATGDTTGVVVQVAVTDAGTQQMYEVLIPMEWRTEVHHYLAERMDLSIPLEHEPLVLDGDQASQVIGLARGGY